MRITSALFGLALLGATVNAGLFYTGLPAAAHEGEEGLKPAERSAAPAEVARAKERWKAFREHVEAQGRKDLLPETVTPEAVTSEEGAEDAPAPSADAIIGILFRMSPDLAAAQDLLEREPPNVAGARERLTKLEDTKDAYLAEYAGLLKAKADLMEKKYGEARKGFEKIVASSRNLATPTARRGLAECYRGLDETTFEILELRMLVGCLPPGEGTADRSWAEGRLAEIRRDHSGPLSDTEKRMREISTRLASVKNTDASGIEGAPGEQKKVEEILAKIAKILDDEAKRCPMCQSMACKSCKKCGACTASGQCEGEHVGQGQGQGDGQGKNGQPKGNKQGGPADRSKVAKEDLGDKQLKDPASKDKDAWGSVNEREVAKAMQDLWGKIPPSYRQVVAEYFKDISGVGAGQPAGK